MRRQSRSSTEEPGDSVRHGLVEDVLALLIGSAFVVVGLMLLRTASLTTGGIAGISLLLSYLLPWRPGLIFFVLNLPFLVLAWRAVGVEFMAKTAVVNLLIAGFSALSPRLIGFAHLDPLFAAIFGGVIIGVGILLMARHRASVGGLGVLALWLQEARGLRAGRTMIATDLVIIAGAGALLDWRRFLLSAASAVALGSVLAMNHKPGRYAGH